MSVCACPAAALVCWSVPLIVPSGGPSNPVTEVPGLNPTSPFTTVGPVFVTVVAPRTP